MAMKEIYQEGVLFQRWNETNYLVETMNPDGTVASSVPMTPEEVADADAYKTAQTEAANEAEIIADLEALLATLQAIIDDTNANINQNPASRIKDIARTCRKLIRLQIDELSGTD